MLWFEWPSLKDGVLTFGAFGFGSGRPMWQISIGTKKGQTLNL